MVDTLQNNPFSVLVGTIRGDTKAQLPTSYRLGTVISTSPIIVDVAGNNQDKDSLLKNELITDLKTGDNLLLAPIDDEQRYIIICKVVSI